MSTYSSVDGRVARRQSGWAERLPAGMCVLIIGAASALLWTAIGAVVAYAI